MEVEVALPRTVPFAQLSELGRQLDAGAMRLPVAATHIQMLRTGKSIQDVGLS